MRGQEEFLHVFVGRKKPRDYAEMLQDRLESVGRAVVLARGRFIKKACDACEIVRRRVEGVEYERIELGSEMLADHAGAARPVSCIRIELVRR